jgi:two-component system sensor histidine kinase DesK
VLAWCLREAVTNVIRHSRARHCRIRLIERMDEVSLEVTDDGRGFPGQDPEAPEGPEDPENPDSAHGSGLRGVSERLSAIGGRLSLGPADGSGSKGPGHGFRLIATVPSNGQL